MGRLGLLSLIVVFVSSCSYLGETSIQPAEPVVSGFQTTSPSPPPAIQAQLMTYARCQSTSQQAPQYAGLRDKLFFTGVVPLSALSQAAIPNDEEQVALAKWEVDRKNCVLALDTYINFFTPFDKIQQTLLNTYQDSIRAIHNKLIRREIGYGPALQQIRKANSDFWTRLAERNKYVRDFIITYWLDDLTTP
jgi:hypothetical protein